MDAKTKLVKAEKSTGASTHDSQPMPDLVEPGNLVVNADSVYTGEKIAADLQAKGSHNYIHEKSGAGDPLAKEQQLAYLCKAKAHARVEHPLCL